MVVRTQLSLDGELHQRAKEKAARLGLSLAEYFRRVIGADLTSREAKRDVTAIFDLGRSGMSDVSENVDRYVGEAIEAEYLSESGT